MSDIPQELMDEARRLAATLSIHHSDTDRIEVIARALMARDQRAAEIARSETRACNTAWQYAGEHIATAILTYGASNDQ